MKSILLLGVVLFAAGSDAASCLDKLPMMKKVGETRATCIADLKLNATQVPDATQLKDRHFKDFCVSNCSLTSLNFFNNGTFLKDKILEQLKKEASTEVYDKLAKVVDTCIEMANKKPEKKDKKDKKEHKDKKDKKDKKGTKEMGTFDMKKMQGFCNCRKAAKFIHCMVEEDQKLC